ncbi:MAG: DnaB-like helicase C-terminal domain-containing protein [Actinomycetota bacterium]
MSQAANSAGHAPAAPRTVAGLIDDLQDQDVALARELIPIPTHFEPLDHALGGGLRAGELMVVGGPPGVGKTIATLQWARSIAMAGGTAIYACYEHDETALLTRLIALELGELPRYDGDEHIERLREGFRDVAEGRARLADVLTREEFVRRAYGRVREYAERLWLVRCSSVRTGVPALEEMVEQRKDDVTVLFVDYLQKVALHPESADDAEKATRVVEALKELALSHRIPVVAVVAGDRDGLSARRVRLNHLSSSAALAYEADVAIILNDKTSAVSKVHLAYDTVRAKTFRDYTVFSIEKNRGGPATLDLEFRKDFVYFRFNPSGGLVAERLVDERYAE